MRKAFDNLFATLKTKETDKGVAVYSMVHDSGSEEVHGVNKDSLQTIGTVSSATSRNTGAGEVAKALQVIERAFPGATVSEVSVSGRHATALRSIAGLFKRELVFFKGEYTDGSVIPAEGAVVDIDGKRIYVNAYSEKPHLQVLGHELLHALKQNDI